jgi:lipopolysaccharide/colanic/teichoic acid biosynthesis glycosyltransferase
MKRALDFVAALGGLILLAPVFVVVSLWIWFYDRGPVLFPHRRVGQHGWPFKMLKFRSMVVDAGKLGPQLTIGDDRRITPVGRLLRASKMDELPQLWNVLRGEMSLVGPRPEVEAFVQLYTIEQRDVLRLQPGITDPASFAFYNESELLGRAADPDQFYREQLMPEKIRINLEYAAHANVLTDLVVILATLAKPLGIHIDIFTHFSIRPSPLTSSK